MKNLKIICKYSLTFTAHCGTMGTVKETYTTERMGQHEKDQRRIKRKDFDSTKYRYVVGDENHIYRITKNKICTDDYFKLESWECVSC